MLRYQLFTRSVQISDELINVVKCFEAHYEKINIPVLFGINGNIDKYFSSDALSGDGRIVIEIEADRATENNQFKRYFCCRLTTFNRLKKGSG